MEKAVSVSELYSKSKFILSILSVVVLIIGLVFKFMHWPGAGTILIASLVGIVIALLEHIISNIKSKDLIRNIIYPLLGVFYVLGILFKVMHWPGAGNMIIVSIVGISIALAQFAFSLRKSIYAILPLLGSIFWLFILFRIMHWPEPAYILYGSYFAFSILVPIFIFSKWYKLKSSNTSLSNHFLFLGALSIMLFIVESLNKAAELEKIDWISLNNLWIIGVLLFSSLVLVITKTLKIFNYLNYSHSLKNHYQLLKCLKCIYILILVLYVLVDSSKS